MFRSTETDNNEEVLSTMTLGRNKRCRSRPASSCDFGVMLMLVALCLVSFPSSCTAFSMVMEYKPPVKSSVSKFYDRRLSSSQSSGSSSGSGSSSESHKGQRPPSSKAAVAGAAYATQPSSFEQRMRDALFRGVNAAQRSAQQSSNSRTTAAPSVPPNLVTVESLQDYKRVVSDETERLVAVRFHASYCRACKAVTPAYIKLARMHPDIVFVDVPVTEKNAVLHQGLGVPSLPFAHIYHPWAGLVEETKLLRQNVASFRETLLEYLQGSCTVPEEEEEACNNYGEDLWA